jgi:hypothetical protein
VAGLQAWFKTLDAEMKDALSALSDADLDGKKIVRESGYETPIEYQMDIYLQALLIFFGKLSVTLKALDKPLTKAMQDWVW